MERKKILFLDHTPFIGGAQLSLISLIGQIDKKKYKVIVVCSKKARQLGLTNKYDCLGIKYYVIDFGQLKSFRIKTIYNLISAIKNIKWIISKDNIDIVFANTVRACIVGSLSSMLGGAKIVWFIQDITFPKSLFKILSFIPRKILYVSKYLAAYYPAVPDCRQEIINIWRDNYSQDIGVEIKKVDAIKRKWGIEDKAIVIGYIGRLVEQKGAQVLIKAVNILVDKNKKRNIKCIIIGSGVGQEGDNENELKKMAGDIVFTGQQENIPLLLKIIDILCIPSLVPEGYPSVAIEAMMSKVPVIGTDVGGTAEIIKPGITGLLVRPNNSKDLSKAILEIIKDKDLKEKIISNAYKEVLKHNTSEYAAYRISNIFESMN
ncbi:glycosyltransferase family 4 protein [Candidatus Parcubacteria bacterium]|nr:glycosyltransferase family 4 protein [Candidatus Parcubacteria bacterium]